MTPYVPKGGAATGDLLRRFDWSGTSLGPIPDWPPSLRTSVDIMLNSPIAMLLMWGADHVMLYNEQYAAIAGARHPAALGATVQQVWPEIWDANRALLAAAFCGEVQVRKENMLILQRNGAPQEIWFDLFYTPVRDAAAAVAGVLCTVLEMTRKVQQGRQLQRSSEELGALNMTLQAEGQAVKQANARLSEERSLLRALFEQAPSFMALLRGPDHVFELTNQPFLQLSGHRALIGKALREALPELMGKAGIAELDQVYRTGVPFNGKQVRASFQHGPDAVSEARFVDIVYQPIRAADGGVLGILVEGIDVTERMASEERLQIAQQAGGIGSFEWFPDSGEMVVSATYRRIWGISDEQEVNTDFLVSMIDEQDRHLLVTEQVEQKYNPLRYVEYRIRRPDNGALRWIARQGEVVGGPAHQPCRYVGVSFDVTERKLIEQALRASQGRLAAIFGQASVGLSELDLEGGFQRVNGALCSMLGRTSEQLLEMNLNELIHPDDVPGNCATFQLLVETGASFIFEKCYLKPDRSQVWVSSSVSRMVDDQGRPQALIAVHTDITERRRIEAALRELNDTLEQRVAREVAERIKAEEALSQSQKMEAVGQLTGGVAHDFNNVLQIISGNLHLLSQSAMPDSVTRKRLETALAAVERGAKLSSHLLAFARRQPLQPVAADLGRLVRNMDELLRRALDEAVDISIVVGWGLWNTLIDRGQIENVILNLAINARDAMQGQGRLTIELGNAVLDEFYVSNLVDVPAGQYVVLSVSDTGCGMSEAVLQRAFEPFFTTKPSGEGTGLGLSMAYGFVKQSRGHIRIYSELGHGTSVKIYLPRSLQAEAPDLAAPMGAVVGGSETILVVEDDAGVQATVVDMLAALGYQVLRANDGESALMQMQGGAAIDLLFTDVVMPGPVRNPDLARQAQEILPDIAVLFTSGYPQNAIVHGGRLDPGIELLSKPYRREELAHKLRHVLANRQQRMQAKQFLYDNALHLLAPESSIDNVVNSLKILVVEDNLDSQQMVCELVGMLGHTVSGVSDAEQAWELMREQDFDILFTDVSLPGISGIDLARKVTHNKPSTRIIFSTGYGKESLAEIGIKARFLRKPYDLMELKAALDNEA